ncbi:MAG: DUF1573 domain-containing protein [Candidatus Levybacteria bacterium]|nr:DUF1573 domain-containing protein [Candidatus Levybacteria bacterium]
MNEKKVIIAFVIATVWILLGGVYFIGKSTTPAQVASSQEAKAVINKKTYDWGTIPYDGGLVKADFAIKNEGNGALQLTNIKTSCACTKAQVAIDGTQSPFFSMHSVSSWVGEVLSGKQATLTVIFDPAFHGPSGVGSMTRLISIETNDQENRKLEFTLNGTVVK